MADDLGLGLVPDSYTLLILSSHASIVTRLDSPTTFNALLPGYCPLLGKFRKLPVFILNDMVIILLTWIGHRIPYPESVLPVSCISLSDVPPRGIKYVFFISCQDPV